MENSSEKFAGQYVLTESDGSQRTGSLKASKPALLLPQVDTDGFNPALKGDRWNVKLDTISFPPK